MCEF
jgi:hypothetical protein